MKWRLAAGDLKSPVRLRLCRQLPGVDMSTMPELVTEMPTRARIDAVGGSVYLGSVQVGEAVTHYIYIRARKNLGAEWEVVHGSAVYRVRRVAPLNDQPAFMRLDCEELRNG
ncbi:head-tail adaptor protein [Chromobacterium sp. S0633]|uniref:head-tail adaptor protein n=1 Tax=Chromobacterium sp. S0633 TaxID=2957805 RepID=UPI0020A0B693|nr:head-tail adaptor protein [Chromobacterium sp. S0633]MCP1289826.1 head-tail adaptor protein [Chromobacterium sp. S0633]